jgi:hypothetical protein
MPALTTAQYNEWVAKLVAVIKYAVKDHKGKLLTFTDSYNAATATCTLTITIRT